MNETLRCKFTREQIAEFSQELARQIQTLQRLEDQKREVVASFKAQIETANAQAKELSQRITNGYEYRSVDCFVEMNDPEAGTKSIYRRDTGELVRSAKMAGEDLQYALPMDEPASEDQPANPAPAPETANLSMTDAAENVDDLPF